MASIRLDGVCKRYGAVTAVSNLSLTCPDGELLALLGPSGCGKTSTLKMIAGIEDVSAGEICFADRPVTALDPAKRNVAMVFEDYALYPHLTVAQNVAFPLEIRGRPRPDVARAVDDMLALLGLDGLRDVGVRQLSGGAQQRVAIGRALVRDPAVILFDEPLSHLDGSHKAQLRAEIKRLQKDSGVTGVLVTHDQTEAMAMADRVAVMNDGVLQQHAAPAELYEHPENLFVAQFIGEPPMNLFRGRLVEGARTLTVMGDGWRATLPPPLGAAVRRGSGDVVLGVRPEHIDMRRLDGAPLDTALNGRVFFRESRGDVDVLLVSRSGGAHPPLVTVETPAGKEWKEGDGVAMTLRPDALHVFDAATGRNLA
ncbi:MAG TPA: ABC transporter ATP-binding protein [Methylomirabilota bacterium]|jgi:ABC-type sugar transport system ATPase subunit